MIDIKMCDSCSHIKVCGKKDKYERYMDVIEKLCVSHEEKKIMYAKDDGDVYVDLSCKHYEKYYPVS